VWRSLLAGLVVALVGFACGPSVQSIYEGNVRFEHCYRLDMDTKIAAPHREHCWRDWTEIYAYGQPLDHVEYARRRIVALESGDTGLVTVYREHHQERVFAEVAATAAPDTPMAAPAPTSAHEPPPKTAPAVKMASATDPAPAGSQKPGDGCASECESTLSDCERLCSAKQADCAACREDYRHCMRRCFE
jgi:hypothetical protein